MSITYDEVDAAMERLGFDRKIVKSNDKLKEEILGRPRYFIVYSKEGDKFKCWLIEKPGSAIVAGHDFAFLSYELASFGYIKDYDDLAKMIEKNRAPKLKRA